MNEKSRQTKKKFAVGHFYNNVNFEFQDVAGR